MIEITPVVKIELEGSIESLANALVIAKGTEDDARSFRISIEERIAALVETPESGQKTVKAGGLKVTVKRGINYRADVEAISKAFIDHSDELAADCHSVDYRPIKMKESLNVLGYEYYITNPSTYPKISTALLKAVTTTPKKASVVVK